MSRLKHAVDRETGELYEYPKDRPGDRYYMQCDICVRMKRDGMTPDPPHEASAECLAGRPLHCVCGACSSTLQRYAAGVEVLGDAKDRQG